VRRLGIGALLGLSADWRADVLAVARHAVWLQREYWRTEVACPCRGSSQRQRVPAAGARCRTRSTCRRCAPAAGRAEAGIVLSTAEPAALRDGLARIAVTSMSAGSSTEPGGYLTPGEAQEQFAVSDERTPAEVAAMLEAAGYEPVWKDAFPLHA
jgi:2-iminoacetate synthase